MTTLEIYSKISDKLAESDMETLDKLKARRIVYEVLMEVLENTTISITPKTIQP